MSGADRTTVHPPTVSVSTTPMPTVTESSTGSSTRKSMGRQSIKVRHNMETAHRLSLLPGKCENIHGHSWWVELEIIGNADDNGIILEFGSVKRVFREYLDSQFDHRIMLNGDDPLVKPPVTKIYPGVRLCDGDPTTENVAKWIGEWAVKTIGSIYDYNVTVWETSVNCATWSYVASK